MKKYLLICFTIVFSFSSHVHAQSKGFSIDDNKGGMYVELGGRSNPNAIGGEIGITSSVSEYLTIRGGLAFLASDSSDDIFGGLTSGVRFHLGKTISPFIGFGVFVGLSVETVAAEDDDIDNDDDGFTDEVGEEETEVTDIPFASIYPEIGVHLFVSDTTRLTATSKYQLTTEGRRNDYWMYSFGMAFSF